LYVGGSGPGNYSTIQDAVNAASNGDSVFVFDDSSPYDEDILVDKSITMTGEDRQTTVINGYNYSIFLRADDCTVQGFTVLQSFHGIRIEAENTVIMNNILQDNTIGLYLFEANYSQIEGNVISNNSVGLCLVFSADVVISGNTIVNNMYDGIELYTSTNTLVTLNDISGNGQFGVSIGGDNNTVLKNNIVGNAFYGVYIQNSRMNSILDNNIYDNHVGNAVVFTDSWTELIRRPFNNSWDGNYWGRSSRFPKAIVEGKQLIIPSGILFWFIRKVTQNPEKVFPMPLIIPMITFDRHPAQNPYDLS